MGWVVNATPRPLYPRERPGTHCIGGWVGSRAGLDGCRKSRPPPGFDPRTLQPVASRYIDWAIAAHCLLPDLNNIFSMSVTGRNQSADLLTISDHKRSLSPCHITTATEGQEKELFPSSKSPSRGSQVAFWARRSCSQKFTREGHVS
jgi:hypothetical protein